MRHKQQVGRALAAWRRHLRPVQRLLRRLLAPLEALQWGLLAAASKVWICATGSKMERRLTAFSVASTPASVRASHDRCARVEVGSSPGLNTSPVMPMVRRPRSRTTDPAPPAGGACGSPRALATALPVLLPGAPSPIRRPPADSASLVTVLAAESSVLGYAAPFAPSLYSVKLCQKCCFTFQIGLTRTRQPRPEWPQLPYQTEEELFGPRVQ